MSDRTADVLWFLAGVFAAIGLSGVALLVALLVLRPY